MKSFGYDKSLNRFLDEITLDYSGPIRILDAGCGTGILGLNLLKRFPESSLVATDLEPNFLESTLENSKRLDLDNFRLELGISNISRPKQVTGLDGRSFELCEGQFDIICLGAVLGYSENISDSLRHLVSLLAPKGTLINLEMNESAAGNFVSRKYHYHNPSIDEVRSTLTAAGCNVSVRKFGLKHLPAKFTRIGIIATRQE